MLTVAALTMVMLATVGNVLSASPTAKRTGVACDSTSASETTGQATVAAGPDVALVNTHSFVMADPNVGFMQGSLDAQGNVWVGEMNVNKLVEINTKTGNVLSCSPPGGAFGIMQTTVDTQGAVWYTEQNANYIGKYAPSTQQFTTYPLAKVSGHSAGPQDLAFDSSGKLWFTEVSGGRIGRLDPTTSTVTSYLVPPLAGGAPSYPFSLAITRDGQVWFGSLSGGAVGHVDPATGHVTLYSLPDSQAQIYSMSADASGRLWFTELEQGKLGMVDSHTGKVTEVTVPPVLGAVSGLYGIAATSNGVIWFACASANALVRYVPQSGSFTFFPLAIPHSIPFGLSLDHNDMLWFTADQTPNNYVGGLLP